MDRRLDFFADQIEDEEEEDSEKKNKETTEKEAFTIDYDEFSHEPTKAEEISIMEVIILFFFKKKSFRLFIHFTGPI